MEKITIRVTNDTGLHPRPADLFVRTAKLYEADITVRNGEKTADAKNIIKVILLNVSKDTQIELEADGPDAAEALRDLTRLIKSDFTQVNEGVNI